MVVLTTTVLVVIGGLEVHSVTSTLGTNIELLA